MSLLEVERLRVAFAGREVVHGLEFGIEAGEKLALVGESGSGKSVSALSLLRLVQGAVISGRALWQGEDLLRMNLPRLRGVRGSEIGMVFQEPMTALNPLFSVGDQIAGFVIRADTGIKNMAELVAYAKANPGKLAYGGGGYGTTTQLRLEMLNLGGIANITWLPAADGNAGEVLGFDTGPANGLLDAWCQEIRGEAYDAAGAWAASGTVHAGLLERLLAERALSREAEGVMAVDA